jgi:hypothetical protein
LEMEVRISSFINVQRIMNMAPELQNNWDAGNKGGGA